MLGINDLKHLKKVPLVVLWSLKNSPVASSHTGNREFPGAIYHTVQYKEYKNITFYKMKMRREDGLIS